ncbi:MAG: DNA polymerase III subunit beta [bacterium]|nr:DNA polymerase III subunit beta [bacterium]
MKVSCLQENLNKGLSIVSRLVSSKTQLPVLNNILISTEKERLKLSATNLETGINLWIGAKVEKEGAISISSRALTELISSLPAGQINLGGEGELLRISCGSCEAVLNGLSAKEFPPVPSASGEPLLSIPTDIFSESISQVALAAAQDEGRPALTGVKWFTESGNLNLVATDGYRLSLKKTSLKNASLDDGLIIPARALWEVAHIAQQEEKKEKGVVSLSVLPGENQVSFSMVNVEIATRLIEGEFPAFAKIIPQETATKVVVERETLLKATKVASIFARDSANIVKWTVGKGKLTLSANSPQVGENSSEMEARVEGEEGEIAFNFRFLLDFLGAVKSKEVVFEMSGPLSPGVFRPSDDDSFLHIIMPVRVQG